MLYVGLKVKFIKNILENNHNKEGVEGLTFKWFVKKGQIFTENRLIVYLYYNYASPDFITAISLSESSGWRQVTANIIQTNKLFRMSRMLV